MRQFFMLCISGQFFNLRQCPQVKVSGTAKEKNYVDVFKHAQFIFKIYMWVRASVCVRVYFFVCMSACHTKSQVVYLEHMSIFSLHFFF